MTKTKEAALFRAMYAPQTVSPKAGYSLINAMSWTTYELTNDKFAKAFPLTLGNSIESAATAILTRPKQ